jgi:hypothetical protein
MFRGMLASADKTNEQQKLTRQIPDLEHGMFQFGNGGHRKGSGLKHA